MDDELVDILNEACELIEIQYWAHGGQVTNLHELLMRCVQELNRRAVERQKEMARAMMEKEREAQRQRAAQVAVSEVKAAAEKAARERPAKEAADLEAQQAMKE